MRTHVPSCRPNGIVEGEIQRALNLAKTRKTANTFYVPLMLAGIEEAFRQLPVSEDACVFYAAASVRVGDYSG